MGRGVTSRRHRESLCCAARPLSSEPMSSTHLAGGKALESIQGFHRSVPALVLLCALVSASRATATLGTPPREDMHSGMLPDMAYSNTSWWCTLSAAAPSLCWSNGRCEPDERCMLGYKPTAVLLSNRGMKASLVEDESTPTLRTFCKHMSVQMVLIVGEGEQFPFSYRQCRLLVLRMNDVLDSLENLGFHPRSVCNLPPANRTFAIAQKQWDKNPMHNSCFNLVRFYLAELPLFSRQHTHVFLLDDDIIIQQSPAHLLQRSAASSAWLHANCQLATFDASCDAFRRAVERPTLSRPSLWLLSCVTWTRRLVSRACIASGMDPLRAIK